MSEIGRIQRDRQSRLTRLDEQLAEIRKVHDEADAPLAALEQASIDALGTWCAANRDAITEDGSVKHHRFSHGQVSWRLRPPKVTLRKVDEIVAAIEASRRRGIKAFLVVKKTVSKSAMLAKPDLARELDGVTIVSDGEDFVVDPDAEAPRNDHRTSAAA